MFSFLFFISVRFRFLPLCNLIRNLFANNSLFVFAKNFICDIIKFRLGFHFAQFKAWKVPQIEAILSLIKQKRRVDQNLLFCAIKPYVTWVCLTP